MEGQVLNELSDISGTLHVRHIEENNSTYTLFWLENNVTKKEHIDIHSVYAPFLIKNDYYLNHEFLIENIKSLSSDRNINKQLFGLVELLQFTSKDGLHRFKNSGGSTDIRQEHVANQYNIYRLKQYVKNIPETNFQYLESKIDIALDGNCQVWKNVQAKEKIKINMTIMDSVVVSESLFNLEKSQSKLAKEHWFFELSSDISKWGFKKEKQQVMSLSNALASFGTKEKEMLALLEDAEKLDEWIKENIDFLAHLSSMLETNSLNDKVSQALFATLAFIDSSKST